MIKILVADDHAIVREGLKGIISTTIDLQVTAEAETGQEVFDLIAKDEFDVILLDISLPGRNGLEILKQLKNEVPDMPVLILSVYPEEQYAVRAIKAGAAGYLSKAGAPDELVKAIRRVAWGKKYISASVAEELALEMETGFEKLPHEKLSDREFEIMQRIAGGSTVSKIAQDMLLSVKTISTYRSRILKKMNIKTNADMTLYAVKHGLIE
ncbi:MAG: response regulator transcription factor [Calditrichaeota bacterium]|nr:response regulator transcription factor [Calditrichota bacterium]